MSPTISVIIPTFRDWDRLRLCLDALARQTLAAERFEIIVANNDPYDPDPPYPLPANAAVVVEAKPGSYAARNAAVRVAKGRYLAFTDSDCVPDPAWLGQGLRALEAAPEGRVAGPVPIFRLDDGGRYAFLYEFHTAFRQRENALKGECVTANLMVARDVFDRVGPFDGQLLSGGDREWNQRAQAAGVGMAYAPGAIVAHPSRRSLAEIFAKRRRTARSEAKFGRIGVWSYARPRLRPPINRVILDRAPTTTSERAALFGIMWALNYYGLTQFVAVRLGLSQPVRS